MLFFNEGSEVSIMLKPSRILCSIAYWHDVWVCVGRCLQQEAASVRGLTWLVQQAAQHSLQQRTSHVPARRPVSFSLHTHTHTQTENQLPFKRPSSDRRQISQQSSKPVWLPVVKIWWRSVTYSLRSGCVLTWGRLGGWITVLQQRDTPLGGLPIIKTRQDNPLLM